MIRCPNCKKAHEVVHPSVNRCSCGYGFDGNGKKIDANIPHVVFKQVPQKVTRFVDYRNKPGTALASLIPAWAVQNKSECGCKDMQNRMDRFGTDGCRSSDEYEKIVKHLVQQSDKLIPMLRGIPASLRERGARRLLNKALKLSE